MSDTYFTFPLRVLWGPRPDPKAKKKPEIAPHECIDLAVNCGMVNAGKGYRKNHDNDQFRERLTEACDNKEISSDIINGMPYDCAEVLLGSDLCGVVLGSYETHNLQTRVTKASKVFPGGPFVRMASKYLWPALEQARAEADPSKPWPERGMSWREFRILCAILSVERNRANFAFIGWETIQARSCGFTTKEAFRNADNIPDHLAPPLSHKMIRPILERLENLGFYARFHFSSGKTGGLMAYSVRHTKEELGDAVCDFVNFKDRAGIKANREADAKKCLEKLERAKVGQRMDKQ